MARFLNKLVVVLEYYVCYLTLPCLMRFPRERGCRKIQHSLSVKPMSQEKNLLCFMKCLPWFLVLIAFYLSFILNSSFLLVIFFLFSTIKMWSRHLPFHSTKSPSLNDIFGTFTLIQRLKYKKQKAGNSPEPRQLVSFSSPQWTNPFCHDVFDTSICLLKINSCCRLFCLFVPSMRESTLFLQFVK